MPQAMKPKILAFPWKTSRVNRCLLLILVSSHNWFQVSIPAVGQASHVAEKAIYFVISESAFVQAQFRCTGRTESSLRPQRGKELFARVSHSFRAPAERDHDKIALTLGWCNLGPAPDLDRSVSAAARGRRLRPDAAPLLQSLWDVLCADVSVDTAD